MLVLAVPALVAAGAHAQGFDAQRYLPPVGSSGGLLIERPTVRGPAGGSWGMVFSFADDPVVFRDLGTGQVVARPVRSLDVIDLLGTISLAEAFEIGVDVPLYVAVDGDPMGPVDGAPGLGDIRLVPKVGLDDDREGVQLGFAVPIRFPTGSPWAFRGAGTVTFEPQLLFGARDDGLRLHGLLGYRSRPNLPDPSPIGDEVTFGAGVSARAVRGDVSVDFLLDWLGAIDLTRPGPGLSDLPNELLAGFEWRARALSFTAAAGPGLTSGLGTPNYRIVLGLRLHPDARPSLRGRHDHDHDHDRDYDRDRERAPHRRKLDIGGRIAFAPGSFDLERRSYVLIERVAEMIRARPALGTITVGGFTDSSGDASYNQRLSHKRALRVCIELAARGVDSDRLVPKGYGESYPIASNATAAGRERNRRIEFFVEAP